MITLGAKGVHFVVSKRRSIGERLAHILLVQVGKIFDYLRGCHPVGDQVDNVGDRDAKTADRGLPGEDVGSLGNPVE
jgi:hypothetical protein